MKESIYQRQMRQLLKDAKIEFTEEHKFCKDRKWRFDFVLLPKKVKIAIEINGGIYLKGKHNYGTAYEKDLEKINTAQILGWIVLQYTPSTLTNVLKDLENLGKQDLKCTCQYETSKELFGASVIHNHNCPMF
jgi:hypothetical protein